MSEMTGLLKTAMTGTKNISQLNAQWKIGSLQNLAVTASSRLEKKKKSGTIIQYGMNKRATNHLRAFGLHRRVFFFFFFSFGILFTGEPKP